MGFAEFNRLADKMWQELRATGIPVSQTPPLTLCQSRDTSVRGMHQRVRFPAPTVSEAVE